MARGHKESATVTLSVKNKKLTASALLQRDPHFLNWNRILILGSHDVMVQAMSLQNKGEVLWELHSREDWPSGAVEHRRTGAGIIRRTGMAQGLSIAEDSIQPVAEVAIHEVVDRFRSGSKKGQSAEYWFLQRPRIWPVYEKPFSQNFSRRVVGKWMRIQSANLKFRLISNVQIRDDERISHELEILTFPGVEISPLSNGDTSFATKAASLWFTLRVLLTFGLRQYIYPLAEHITLDDTHTSTWHTVELGRRSTKSDHLEDFHRPHLLDVLPNAAPRLFQMPAQRELLHAAAYGYAASFHTLTLESGLTSCVQAIERLVTAYEATHGLDQEILTRKDWKPLARSLKRHLETLELETTVSARVKRTLSFPLKLSLEDRIQRMAGAHRKSWDASTRSVFDGLDKMIKARNDIVHGRMIADANITYVERMRARAIFEKLFLCFLNCGKAGTSIGSAFSQISYHYDEQTT